MHEEIGVFDKIADWMAQHWAWASGFGAFVVVAVTKVVAFFNGLNRLADRMDALADEQRRQREKLEKMMDGEGVDMRVAPVVQSVVSLQEWAERIDRKQDQMNTNIIKLIDRDPRSRPGEYE